MQSSITQLHAMIAQFLQHDTPLNYSDNIELAWRSLEALQDLGYGFTITSLGRETFKVRVIKWAISDHQITSTGEYIANIVDGPVSLAICRAVAEAITYDKILVK